jgi:hypothetical protein
MLSSLALRSSIRGAKCRLDAASLALEQTSFTSPRWLVLVERTYTNSEGLSLPPSGKSSFQPPTSHRPTMPPRHDRPPYQSKHNRSNTPLQVNAGLAAKQRGDDAAGSWKFPKNMTIRDPSHTIQTIGRATNTHITYDNKFEFHFWGSPENV